MNFKKLLETLEPEDSKGKRGKAGVWILGVREVRVQDMPIREVARPFPFLYLQFAYLDFKKVRKRKEDASRGPGKGGKPAGTMKKPKKRHGSER